MKNLNVLIVTITNLITNYPLDSSYLEIDSAMETDEIENIFKSKIHLTLYLLESIIKLIRKSI